MKNKSIYPKYYFYRNGESDRDWILKMMNFIPEEHKDKIASRYERIYRDQKGQNRKRAQKFLHRVARFFYSKSNTRRENGK